MGLVDFDSAERSREENETKNGEFYSGTREKGVNWMGKLRLAGCLQKLVRIE